jgi:putative hydrolases of HD superfamily
MDGLKNRLKNIITFVQELELIKDTLRTAYTSKQRRESTAEHSFRLAMLAITLEDEFPDYNIEKVLKLCLIHDLGEIYAGDIPAIVTVDKDVKLETERVAIKKLDSMLPHKNSVKLTALWEEYNACETNEAKLVKALDKIETIIQHNQGANPPNFDYEFNLEYGKEYCNFNETIIALRELVDLSTNEKCSSNKFTGKEN